MRFDPQAGITWLKSRFVSRRAHPRLHQDTLVSSLGPVIDLSQGGARVIARRTPKGRVEMQLIDLQQVLRLDVEIMWSRRLGFFRHEVGLRFLNLTPNALQSLTRLATDNRLRRQLKAA